MVRISSRTYQTSVRDITSRQRPFLHALASNVNAIRLYEKLGFRHRRDLLVSVLTPE